MEVFSKDERIFLGWTLFLFMIIVVMLISREQTPPLKKDWKLYSDSDYRFEILYPFRAKKVGREVIFTGSEVRLRYYPQKSASEAFETVRRSWQGISFRDARDIRIHTCTARKVIIETPSGGQQYYYFFVSPKGAFSLDWKYPSSRQRGDMINTMMESLRCF